MQEHGKQYKNDDTEIHRFLVWKSNLELIVEHNKNSDKHGYTLGMNHFGDLTTAEFAAIYNGYRMPPKSNSTHKIFKPRLNFGLEDNVDWRQKGAVTEVKNQGTCGSCWAFSTTGTLEGQQFLKSGQLVLLSEQNLIDCSSSYGNYGCNGGLVHSAFDYIINNGGIDTEFSYPYQGNKYSSCNFYSMNVGATMSNYVKIKRGDVNALTQAISSIGPIAVAMDASLSTFKFYKHGVYSDVQCSSSKLNHAVLAVGYGTYGTTPYFLVKNSWGPSWGMEGYVMIARNSSNMCGLATNALYPIV